MLVVLMVAHHTSARDQPELPSAAPTTDKQASEEAEAPPESIVLVEGQTTDSCGMGLEDLPVVLRRKASGDNDGEIIAKTTTDEFGDFVLLAPEAVSGDVVLTVSKTTYADLIQELHLDPDEEAPFVGAGMVGNIHIRGRVVDHLSEKPIAGASVQVANSCRELTATTDDQGRFEIKDLSPGWTVVTLQADDFGREVVRTMCIADSKDDKTADNDKVSGESEDNKGVATADQRATTIYRLKPERVIHLTVVDDADVPILGVTAECFDKERDDFRTCVSDEKGQATIKGLHFDTLRLALRLTHEEHVSSCGFDRVAELEEDQLESSHEFVLPRAGIISGKIIDAGTREPVNGARVVAGDVLSDDTPRDFSDDHGKYTIRGVPRGPSTLTVHSSGYAPDTLNVDVNFGQTTTCNIRLKAPTLLEGVVNSQDGTPIARAFVRTGMWRGAATLGLRTLTDGQGKFQLFGVPHDGFEITVHAPGFNSVTQTVIPDGGAVEIVLPTRERDDSTGRSPRIKIGDDAPPFDVKTLKALSLKLADQKGKTVLLDFWATWCAPCMAQIPDLVVIQSEFSNRDDFIMISVSLDLSKEALTKCVEKNRMAWHHVWGKGSGARPTADAYGVGAVPVLFLIGPDGKIIETDLTGKAALERLRSIFQDKDKP